jgi:hypothetical protein
VADPSPDSGMAWHTIEIAWLTGSGGDVAQVRVGEERSDQGREFLQAMGTLIPRGERAEDKDDLDVLHGTIRW